MSCLKLVFCQLSGKIHLSGKNIELFLTCWVKNYGERCRHMQKHTQRFFTAPDESCFIFGPRGTGKSTWIKDNLKNSMVINLLDEKTLLQYLSNPGHIKEVVLGNEKHCDTFVVDEIQKIPQMLDSIHDLIETNKKLRFVLTGSSARKLKRSGINLLAGRAILKKMHPFMASELGNTFDLDFALKNGMLPLIINAQDPQEKLAAYVSLYLKEEVQAEALVRNIGNFARFLEVMSFSHGAILNLSNIARECGTSRKIIENYLSILEDLLLCYLLPVFTKRAKREVVSHPKFYYFDAGVYYNLRPKGPLDKTSEINGIALEGLILQHLRAWNDYSKTKHELSYWRTKSGSEVDFVIYGEQHFLALEIKNSTKVFSKDLKALKAFISDYEMAKAILLYRGKDKLLVDGITCWPVADFLAELRPDHLPGFN